MVHTFQQQTENKKDGTPQTFTLIYHSPEAHPRTALHGHLTVGFASAFVRLQSVPIGAAADERALGVGARLRAAAGHRALVHVHTLADAAQRLAFAADAQRACWRVDAVLVTAVLGRAAALVEVAADALVGAVGTVLLAVADGLARHAAVGDVGAPPLVPLAPGRGGAGQRSGGSRALVGDTT